MELIDFEGIFQKKILEIYEKNKGKYDQKRVHRLVRKAYSALADSYLPAAGCTPRAYFSERTDAELAALLAEYAASDYAVPELLIAELSERPPESYASLLSGEPSAKLVRSVALAAGGAEVVCPRYLEIMASTEDDELAEQLFDLLSEHPDVCKARALSLFREGKRRAWMLDLFSRMQQDDEIFGILLRELKEGDDLALSAKYLARYGDARALPAIRSLLEREDIDFAEFQELRCALEALGESFESDRDFSDDPAYLAVQASAHKQEEE